MATKAKKTHEAKKNKPQMVWVLTVTDLEDEETDVSVWTDEASAKAAVERNIKELIEESDGKITPDDVDREYEDSGYIEIDGCISYKIKGCDMMRWGKKGPEYAEGSGNGEDFNTERTAANGLFSADDFFR